MVMENSWNSKMWKEWLKKKIKQFEISLEYVEHFNIGDTSNFSEYTNGGIIYEVKLFQRRKRYFILFNFECSSRPFIQVK